MTAACASCSLAFDHEHGPNGWRITVHSQTSRGRSGGSRWSYSLDDMTDRRRPGYSSPARYGSDTTARAAARSDAEACR